MHDSPLHGHRHSIALVDPGLLADPVRGNPAGLQSSVYMGLHWTI